MVAMVTTIQQHGEIFRSFRQETILDLRSPDMKLGLSNSREVSGDSRSNAGEVTGRSRETAGCFPNRGLETAAEALLISRLAEVLRVKGRRASCHTDGGTEQLPWTAALLSS